MTNSITELEQEWARYKYLVLEKSPRIYQQIRQLLKDKTTCPSHEFYHLIRTAIDTQTSTDNFVNAAQHVWGYFKKCATKEEKRLFCRQLELLQRKEVSISDVRQLLWDYTKKYQQDYLLNSYFFSPDR